MIHKTLPEPKELMTVSRKIFKHQLSLQHTTSEGRLLRAYIKKIDDVRVKFRRKPPIPYSIQSEALNIISVASAISKGYPITDIYQFKPYQKK